MPKLTPIILASLLFLTACKGDKPGEPTVFIEQVNPDSLNSKASIVLYNPTSEDISLDKWRIGQDGLADYYQFEDKEIASFSITALGENAVPLLSPVDSMPIRLYDRRGRQVDVWVW